MAYDVELVGKIGSMALIDNVHHEIDYNCFLRISRFLHPGVIWISSGATEIGRLDYIQRNGKELEGNRDEVKTDYAAQGQPLLMKIYSEFVRPQYSLRQVLIEHTHFNDDEKREHIKNMLLRSVHQNAIPIINYNDAVSYEENRKMEIKKLLSERDDVVELVDNDETAGQIACLVKAEKLVILSTLDGIYSEIGNPDSLIREISGATDYEVIENITKMQEYCSGASRAGANGAKAKLEYIKPCVQNGTKVYIASAKYDIPDVLSGKVPCTVIAKR